MAVTTDSDSCRLESTQTQVCAELDTQEGSSTKATPECVQFDGPDNRWREHVLTSAWIQLGAETPRLSWPSPVCGTAKCVVFDHITWESPQKLEYPAGICVYCGVLANTEDHLLPQSWTGLAVRKKVLTVPACSECNCAINDRYLPSITDRREMAHRYIKRKYRRVLKIPRWSQTDLAELGQTLRSSVERGLHEQRLAKARLAWPEDADYDLRVMHLSGIENPYEIGLLSKKVVAA